MIARALLLVVVLAAVPGSADPQPPALVTTIGYRYVPGDPDVREAPLEMPEGAGLRFANIDIDLHTVTSFDTRLGRPLFETDQIGFGSVVPVSGAEQLPPGDFAFFCRVHPEMIGILRVLPS